MELFLSDRSEWRRWLEENHSTVKEIWLVYYKKPSGKKRIPYNDAVEEALCFGWIDGKIRSVNDEYYIQRFTPRRPGSRWSQLNVTRVKKLMEMGLMHDSGLEAWQLAVDNPDLVYETDRMAIHEIPADLLEGLKSSAAAYENFLAFSDSSRNLYIGWLNSSKREATRAVRIKRITSFAEKNQKPGML